MHEKSERFHNLIVLSVEQVTITWSTGENFTAQIPLLWPLKVPRSDPSVTDHN